MRRKSGAHRDGAQAAEDPKCTATQCNSLQLTATHANALQLTPTHCNTIATHCNTGGEYGARRDSAQAANDVSALQIGAT